MDLSAEILKERLASYVRLRGGFPVPLAGATYWAAVGGLGYVAGPSQWVFWSFIASGTIFPLAILYAAAFRNNFLKDKNALGGVLLPAFISMLLFWPMAIAAWWAEVQLVPLVLAIGMSLHWPVIGWSYGRTALFAAHAVVRAIVVFLIWWLMPDGRFTLLPISVAVIYLGTVLAILIDSGAYSKKMSGAPREAAG
jgi:hypothetical protein